MNWYRLERNRVLVALGLIMLSGCRASAPIHLAESQEAFWASVQSLCGQAYAGKLVQGSPGDTAFARKQLVMHVHECSNTTLRIPFNAGDNRSRTWVLTRTSNGLRLKHEHRHEDGSDDAVTQYGGDTRSAGTSSVQEFHADPHTVSLIPAAITNIWTIEVLPGQRFVYALRREGTDRRVRIEFDLTSPVPTPPPSWAPPR
jgi:hypothetical protein